MNTYKEALLIFIASFRNNKLRNILSMTGVAIGVFCIVSVISVFDSLQSQIKDNMSQLGTKVLYVSKYPWIPEDDGPYAWWKYKSRPVCTFNELQLIKLKLAHLQYAAIKFNEMVPIQYDNKNLQVMLNAVSSDFHHIQNIEMKYGNYFSIQDMQNKYSRKIVVGEKIADELTSNRRQALGLQLKIFDVSFEIIGVIKKSKNINLGMDMNDIVIVPYTAYDHFKQIDNNIGNGFVDPVLMVKTNNKSLEEASISLRNTMRQIRKLKREEKDNFSINKLDVLENKLESLFSKIKISGWLIGFFSLIVSCFGIANIMYVSVKERTNEIGLRKALGAHKKQILILYLTESIMLCLSGGLMGLLLIYLFNFLISNLLNFNVFLSFQNFMLGTIISLVVGILAGYFPSKKAADMLPVNALKTL